MGWPRKNEEMRIYKDKGNNGYFMIIMEDEGVGGWGAIVNVYDGPNPSLVYGSVSRGYIAERWLKRMQWDALPDEWKDAFTEYNNRGRAEDEPPFNPNEVRGFWRIGRQPATLKGLK